jgi:hypothetical protein
MITALVVCGLLAIRPIVPSSEALTLAVGPAPGLALEQQADQKIPIVSVEGAGTEDVVTGVPFSATIAIDTTRTLPDGARIVNHSTEQVARDSAGRTRRELRLANVGALQVASPTIVLIYDPTSGLAYTLDPATHRARVTKPQPRSATPAAAESSDRKVVRESLGTQTIEGLSAQGTRTTWTIPAGAIGNDRPISISVEVWYSPDLHTVVLRKRSDPRVGESVYRLTGIRRAEPAPGLFKIPAGYKVISSDSDR